MAWEEVESGAEARKKAATETEPPNSREPVVPSLKWTTSSLGGGGNRAKSSGKVRASGPLAPW